MSNKRSNPEEQKLVSDAIAKAFAPVAASPEEKLFQRLDQPTLEIHKAVRERIRNDGFVRDRPKVMRDLAVSYIHGLHVFDKDELQTILACHLAAHILEKLP